jgi:general secretion pathway protein K
VPDEVRQDRGYALIIALIAVMAFAYVSFQVLAANEGALAGSSASAERARLTAAADAAVTIAVHGLGETDPSVRWAADGEPRHVDFNGVDLVVSVDDEQRKAPLAGLDDNQARALFSGAGASGAQLDALVAEFSDWREQARASEEAGASSTTEIHRFRSLGELMMLKDMSPDLYSQIVPAVTVYYEPGATFDAEHANPLALATMQAMAGAAPSLLTSGPLASQHSALDTAPVDRIIGHTLSVHVTARDRNGATAQRLAVVGLSGSKTEPVWVRYVE